MSSWFSKSPDRTSNSGVFATPPREFKLESRSTSEGSNHGVVDGPTNGGLVATGRSKSGDFTAFVFA